MARLKIPLALGLAAAAVLLWALREDLRLPWQRTYRFETEQPGCVAGIISENYGALGLPTGFISFYLAWGDGFPAAEIKAARAASSILALTWEPYLKSDPDRSLLGEIAAGGYDAYMRSMAAAIKAYRKPVLIRWGHEPNGDWYAWAGAKNSRDAGQYRLAWRRMAGIIRAEAGPKARLVFSVNGEDKPAEKWNRFENYYPGDEYTDAVGLDIYNWGDTQAWSAWSRPNLLLKDPYARALALAPDKPVFLTEVASCSSGGNKAEWVRRLFYRLQSRYTAVKGFMWFDYDKECDWRVSADPGAASVYSAGANSRHFTSDGAGLDWFFKKEKNGR
ncbi:MAG: hypothetical protein A2X35_02440 [Elusimicrobia bacterium GWA2_61_42]|nr:MAG: hypothetical protein A2X35_02440 [Elusimicrobia bacterium GWA2_61_42]OGR75120.1 MAG: hypothetical protein A2X38_06300 [Elusimicrobia bacterium GWC2_61_25]